MSPTRNEYERLMRYLRDHPATQSSVTLTFRQIETIIEDSLPDSARTYPAWWANEASPKSRHTQRVWLEAGWQTRDLDLPSKRVTFVRAANELRGSAPVLPDTMSLAPRAAAKQQPILDRTRQRVDELIARFDRHVKAFENANPFTGPSLYFHIRTLAVLRGLSAPTEALRCDEFYDCLYATLTAWGMHRMGPRGAKLLNLPEIRQSFLAQEQSIRELESLCISKIPNVELPGIVSRLWAILDGLRVGASKTKLIANSKALHHLLPDLMPPIDRAYTLRFFFNNTALNQGDEAAFRELYPHFHNVALACRGRIDRHVGSGPWNTSQTKVIDNAIVGFVSERLKGSR